MASSKWITFKELQEKNLDRKIVFWGASNWIERTLDNISLEVSHIVDNSSFNKGINFHGYEVKSPQELSALIGKIYVVITTVNYQSVIDELHEMGFVMGEDFCCTPLLNERENKDRLKNLNYKVLFASPVQKYDQVTGGGLYLLDTKCGKVEKIYSGKLRGIVRAGKYIIVVDMLRGLVILNNDFEEEKVLKFQKNSEPHGIAYDCKNNNLILAQPGRDSIAVYSLDEEKQIQEFFISSKWAKNKKDNHHINDPLVYGDSIFISMFSFSGNWPNECYDGGVLEMDLSTGKVIGKVMTDMWMPHSTQRVGGVLTCLDSMRGELRMMNHRVLGKFNSFIRGLDYKEGYYFIGASEHRYPEKLKGISNNISLDSGIYIFDSESKMSRFLPVCETESIHSLIVV